MTIQEALYNERRTLEIKKKYPAGTKLELLGTDDRYTSVKNGDVGTVLYVDDAGQIQTLWNDGLIFALVPDEDRFRIVYAGNGT